LSWPRWTDGNVDCNGTARIGTDRLPKDLCGLANGGIRTASHNPAEATDQKVWGSNPYRRARPEPQAASR
jgi:hypothetical protein